MILTRQTRASAAVTALLSLAFAAPATAQIYRWTDEAGNTHFAEDQLEIPARYRNQATKIRGTKKDKAREAAGDAADSTPERVEHRQGAIPFENNQATPQTAQPAPAAQPPPPDSGGAAPEPPASPAAEAAPAPPAPIPESLGMAYRAVPLRFAIAPPAGWTQETPPQQGVIAWFVGKDGDFRPTMAIIHTQVPAQRDSLDAATMASIAQYTAGGAFEILEQQQLDDQKGLIRALAAYTGGKPEPYDFVQVFHIGEHGLFVVQFQLPQGRYSEYRPLIDRVLASVTYDGASISDLRAARKANRRKALQRLGLIVLVAGVLSFLGYRAWREYNA